MRPENESVTPARCGAEHGAQNLCEHRRRCGALLGVFGKVLDSHLARFQHEQMPQRGVAVLTVDIQEQFGSCRTGTKSAHEVLFNVSGMVVEVVVGQDEGAHGQVLAHGYRFLL